MNKQKIADFFDSCAPWWDADMIRNEPIIQTILDNAGIQPGVDVLDVACGTGVLFPDYLKRNVGSVTGIDISSQMVKIASGKFPQIPVICGDVETTDFPMQYDRVMVYNAFPHFPNPQALIEKLASVVKTGGRLSVAHGMSRKALHAHHAGRASSISIELIPETELKALFEQWFSVDVCISNDSMYQVCGIKK